MTGENGTRRKYGLPVDKVDHVAREFMKRGLSDSEIETCLILEGFSSSAAAAAVRRIIDWSVAREAMVGGGVLFVAGSMIALISMLVTQGGAYLLFWSAILFGAFHFLSGMRQMRAIDEALETTGSVARQADAIPRPILPPGQTQSLLEQRWLWWLVGGAVVVFGGYLTWQISAGSMPW